MNYQETLAYLYNSLPMYQKVGQVAFKKDLTNTWALSAHLGHPHQSFKAIHVAGTNGKGSSSHSIAAISQAAGYKTGLYTSPHLKNFTERVKINGIEIPEQEVVNFVAAHQDILEKIQPSFFEMTVGMAFDYFARQQVDFAVIEVGLGGRLDSTNIITPVASLITNISFDHQEMLGDTLEKIAAEKAGIIKPNVPAVISEKQPEVTRVFTEKAESLNAPLFFASDNFQIVLKNSELDQQSVDVYEQAQLKFEDLQLSLAGSYQLKNIAGILQTITVLQEQGYAISDQHIREGIGRMKVLTGLKGRWQVLQRNPAVICDTAHNEAGIRAVMKQLLAYPYLNLHMVMGVAREKKLETILSLLPEKARYYFCQAQIPRALPASDLAAAGKHFGLEGTVFENVNQALKAALKAADARDIIFVGGSSFVVAEIENL